MDNNILLPSKILFEKGDKPNQARLIMEPCFQGYGTTVGNALRRVLLSSLPGAAVTAIKIKGVQHEFTTIPNVLEDVLELTLNIKQLRLKVFSDQQVRLWLRAKGEGKVTAADIEKNADVEIANPDLHLATLTAKDATLEIEFIIDRGRGYSVIEDRARRTTTELGVIQLDALFSPLRNVGYKVENARVGEITNYDKLVMDIETDGTISPEDAVRASSKILINYFELLNSENTLGEEGLTEESDRTGEEDSVSEVKKKKKADIETI